MSTCTGSVRPIPLLDRSPEIEELWDELNAAFQAVLRSGRFILGPNVKALEEEVGAYLGVRHCVGVNSCTDALVIGLRALGVGPGDEVITTPFTFIATAEAATNLGATPVFVDIDPLTFNIDANLIERAITERTKAIIPAHLYGQACDMDAIMTTASKYNLKVLEDVAQALGGAHKGRKLGSIGHAGALSFFPSKNLGGFGDGGMLATNDGGVAELACALRAHGSRKKYFSEMPGYNSRLDELQAALLRVKLKHIDRWNEGRRQVARCYRELLSNLEVTTPCPSSDADHVFHQYTIRAPERDRLSAHLKERGISTMIYYPAALHEQALYRSLGYKPGTLPASEAASQQVLSLPMYPELSAAQQEEIAAAIGEFYRR